ncbi:MAG: hypothetical protein FJ271_10755 [Planctomycetes bacterium]|nr:hypothetical protein [Planctomycetota bacterium]
MRPRQQGGWLAGLAILLVTSTLRADAPGDPLRFVPDKANAIFKVEQPGKIADLFLNHELSRQVRAIQVVAELYDSTNARRFYQLLSYFEKQMGMSTLELLDKLAGGGIAVASELGGGAPPVLLIVQGKDEAVVKKFFAIALDVAEQELARQDVKGGFKKKTYRDVDAYGFDKIAFARVGDAMLLATRSNALKAAIDCYKDGSGSISKVKALADARKALPKGPLAWGWLHLEPFHARPEFKEGIKTVSLQPLFFPVWPLADVVERSPYVAAGIYQQGQEFMTTVRMGSGMKGMSERAALLMPSAKEASTLPLLKPANTLASLSFHLDLGRFWENRKKLIPGKQEGMQLDQLEKASALFLGGVKLSTLLKQAGAHHRLVAVQQTKSVYKTTPNQPIPGFAWVIEMRDPEFARSMETILRGAGLLASTQANLKMVEEKHGPHKIVSYRFPEDRKFGNDTGSIRFNFSPAFVKSGKQMILSSTVELARELADLVAQEGPTRGSTASTHWQFYATGGAAALRSAEKQLRTQYILSQALSPKEAQDQIRQLIALVERLGVLTIETNYGAGDFRLDIRLNLDHAREARD